MCGCVEMCLKHLRNQPPNEHHLAHHDLRKDVEKKSLCQPKGCMHLGKVPSYLLVARSMLVVLQSHFLRPFVERVTGYQPIKASKALGLLARTSCRGSHIQRR